VTRARYYVEPLPAGPTSSIMTTSWLPHRRPFVTTTRRFEFPDGLTIDADGGVWVALRGGKAVHHFVNTASLFR